MFYPFVTDSKTIAIVTKNELQSLYEQTLTNRFSLVLLPVKEKEALSLRLQMPDSGSLELKKDLHLGCTDFIAWMQAIAQKLKMLHTRKDCFHFRDLGIKLYKKEELTIAGTFEYLARAYAKRIMQHGSSIIGNQAFAFKTDDIRTAFKNAKNRQHQQPIVDHAKTFILLREYFTLNGNEPCHTDYEKQRRCFMETFFTAILSFGDWLKKDIYYLNMLQLN